MQRMYQDITDYSEQFDTKKQDAELGKAYVFYFGDQLTIQDFSE